MYKSGLNLISKTSDVFFFFFLVVVKHACLLGSFNLDHQAWKCEVNHFQLRAIFHTIKVKHLIMKLREEQRSNNGGFRRVSTGQL